MTRTIRLICHATVFSFAVLLPANLARAENPPTLDWTRQFGTNLTDLVTGVDIDAVGNAYVSGETVVSGAEFHTWLTKFDPSGNRLWTQQTNGRSGGLAIDGFGNAYITGNFGYDGINYDAWLKKYDSLGAVLWTRQLGASDTTSFAVAVDDLGNPYITGGTADNLSGPNNGDYDAFVTKYDSGGDLLWTRQIGTAGHDGGRGVSIDPLGNAYITGHMNWVNSGPNARPEDAFLAKYDAAGNLLWNRELGTSSVDSGAAVAAGEFGNVFVTGTTRGSLGGLSQGSDDAFIAKYDELGNLLWTRQLGTSDADSSQSVTVDDLGNAYISGATTGSLAAPHLGVDAFLAKYDAAGNVLWSHQFGTENSDSADTIATDGFGRIFVAGATSGNLGGPTAGGYDAFLARFNQAAVPEPATPILVGLAGMCLAARFPRRNHKCTRPHNG